MSNRFAPYDDYQDSGLDWLGKIPGHWELRRLGGFFCERREKVSDKDFPALSVTMQGIVPQLEDAAKTKDGDNRKLVRRGDFVINSRSDRKGSSGVSSLDGSVSLIAIVLEPVGMVPEYVHHLLRSEAFQEEFYRFGKGIVADLWSTNYSSMKNITIPVMSADEQQQIASFLDYETGKIDALIEKQQQLIALLGEKRQAVISHAVTKGLNPDAPMRDSGVEWLGEVPSHWDISQPKHFTTKIIDGPHHTPNYVDEGIPFVTVKNLTSSKGICLEDTKRITEADHELFLKRANPEIGDLLITKDGTLGVTRVVETSEEFSIFVSVALVKLDRSRVNPYFMRACLESHGTWAQFTVKAAGAALKHIVLSTIGNVYIPLPSLEEQDDIARDISKRCKILDDLIGKAEDQVELLQERRTALISAAVTGKIDVRGWKPPSSARMPETEMEVA